MNNRLWLWMSWNLITQPVMTTQSIEKVAAFNSLHKYIDKLYDSNLPLIDNFEKVQSAFCPNKTYCFKNQAPKQTGIGTAIGSDLIGNVSLSELGTCCLPCSCEDSCFQMGDCCLDKLKTQTNHSIESFKDLAHRCVAANSDAYYYDKAAEDVPHNYWMVTVCYVDKLNESLVQLCEQPDVYSIEQAYPVSSLSSGHTYWNYFCALCNNDTDSLQMWSINILSSRKFLFYANGPAPWIMQDNFHDVYEDMVDASAIFYLPPSGLEPRNCIPKYAMLKCRLPNDLTLSSNFTFIRDACQQFQFPVIFQGAKLNVYNNTFCLFCGGHSLINTLTNKCFERQVKDSAFISGLISYTDSKPNNEIGERLDSNGCSCTQVYDMYLVSMYFFLVPRVRGYKTFFVLNSTEHEISTAHKN